MCISSQFIIIITMEHEVQGALSWPWRYNLAGTQGVAVKGLSLAHQQNWPEK